MKQLALTGTDGSTVTLANSGLDRVTANGGSTITYDTARGIKIVTVAGQTSIVGANFPAPNKQFGISLEVPTPSAVPASGFVMMFSVVNSSGSILWGIGYTSAKKVILVGAAGALSVISKTGSNADGTIEPSTQIRVAGVVTIGTSSTTGAFSGHIYTPGSTTPLFSPTPSTGINLGTTDPAEVRIGDSNPNGVYTLGGRYLQIFEGSTTEPAEWIPAVPLSTPVVTLGAETIPSSTGGDGTQVITWPAVSGAASYEAWIANKLSPDQADFTLRAAGVTSPYTFTGLSAGPHAFGVKAKA